MPSGDPDGGKREREGEVEREPAIIVGDIAQQDHVAAFRVHALHDERLADVPLDIAKRGRQPFARHDDLGRNDRGTDALELHGIGPIGPFVHRSLIVQTLGAARGDDLRKRRIDRLCTGAGEGDHHEIGFWQAALDRRKKPTTSAAPVRE